jgi:UDP-GlcNAc:undecaprenyl-phosphate/decaprenyl-phosphate GlcNAc-1-phosphate transferase
MLRDFALALTMSLLVGAPVLALLRRLRLVDRPTARSSHAAPTPRGGGIGLTTALLVALAVSGLPSKQASALAVAAVGFGLLGLADDLWSPPVEQRFALQCLIALATLPWILDGLSGPSVWQVGVALGVWSWLVAYVNAFNFMDGINGLAAEQAIVGGCSWWFIGTECGVPVLALGGALLAGAALGFLPYNFPRARMFLGDVGSYALGAWSAVLVVVALRAGVSPVAALAPVSIVLADTATTIVRRALRGERLFEAHRCHTYQQLVDLGWSHTATTLLVAVTVLCCSLIGVVTLDAGVVIELGAGLAVLLVGAAYLVFPALIERREPTRGSP